jgi:hypothetical protein
MNELITTGKKAAGNFPTLFALDAKTAERGCRILHSADQEPNNQKV